MKNAAINAGSRYVTSVHVNVARHIANNIERGAIFDFELSNSNPVGIGPEGKRTLTLYADFLRWTPILEEQLKAITESEHSRDIELHVLGLTSDRVAEEVRAMGITLRTFQKPAAKN